MLMLARWPSGEHQVLCSTIQVTQDQECGCGCPRLQCGEGKVFQEHSCSCVCEDSSARDRCILSGRSWSHSSCQCECPLQSRLSCSTGYIFDLEDCTSCVQVGAVAHPGTVAALVLLSVTVVISFIAGWAMYRSGRGPFSPVEDTVTIQPKRMRFMTQKSKSEYDLLSQRLWTGKEAMESGMVS